jgi:type IV secretion system protein TrbL
MAVGSAAKDKDIGAPGAHIGSLLGLANAKLAAASGKNAPPPKTHDRL